MKTSILVTLAGLTLLASCSKESKKIVDAIKENKAALQAESAKDEEAKETTTVAFEDFNNKGSLAIRMQMFDELFHKGKKLGEKLFAASMYYKNLDFQVWNPTAKILQRAFKRFFIP